MKSSLNLIFNVLLFIFASYANGQTTNDRIESLIISAENEVKSRNFEQSIKQVQKAEDLIQNDTLTDKLYWRITKIYYKSKKYNEAKSYIEKYLNFIPSEKRMKFYHTKMMELSLNIDADITADKVNSQKSIEEKKRLNQARENDNEKESKLNTQYQISEDERLNADKYFLKAVKTADYKKIEKYLSIGANPNVIKREKKYGNLISVSALSYAVNNQDLKLFEYLINKVKCNPNIDYKEPERISNLNEKVSLLEHLFSSVYEQKFELDLIKMCELACANGAKINTDCLIYAVKNGSLERVEVALKYGANPKDKDNSLENSALYWAKKWGKPLYRNLLKEYNN